MALTRVSRPTAPTYVVLLLLAIAGCDAPTDIITQREPMPQYTFEASACPCSPLDPGREDKLAAALAQLPSDYALAIYSLIIGGQYGIFSSSYWVFGSHDVTHQDPFHFGINEDHPGWGDDELDTLTERRLLARTVLHEYLHHFFDEDISEEHQAIYDVFDDAIPWWDELPF